MTFLYYFNEISILIHVFKLSEFLLICYNIQCHGYKTKLSFLSLLRFNLKNVSNVKIIIYVSTQFMKHLLVLLHILRT